MWNCEATHRYQGKLASSAQLFKTMIIIMREKKTSAQPLCALVFITLHLGESMRQHRRWKLIGFYVYSITSIDNKTENNLIRIKWKSSFSSKCRWRARHNRIGWYWQQWRHQPSKHCCLGLFHFEHVASFRCAQSTSSERQGTMLCVLITCGDGKFCVPLNQFLFVIREQFTQQNVNRKKQQRINFLQEFCCVANLPSISVNTKIHVTNHRISFAFFELLLIWSWAAMY